MADATDLGQSSRARRLEMTLSAAKRRYDPERRTRIIRAALDVIAEHGVAGTTHRRVAAAADVSLGSMTYHFAGMNMLLLEAFTHLADAVSNGFEERLRGAATVEEASEAVVDLVVDDRWVGPRALLLSYELYALAARNPPMRQIMRRWMGRSRAALERHFAPETAKALDAAIEGLLIHRSVDAAPMNRAQVRALVDRLAR